jgi:hypothetical protein
MGNSERNEVKGSFKLKKALFLPTIQNEEIFNDLLPTV